jgi:hypothetical protein
MSIYYEEKGETPGYTDFWREKPEKTPHTQYTFKIWQDLT